MRPQISTGLVDGDRGKWLNGVLSVKDDKRKVMEEEFVAAVSHNHFYGMVPSEEMKTEKLATTMNTALKHMWTTLPKSSMANTLAMKGILDKAMWDITKTWKADEGGNPIEVTQSAVKAYVTGCFLHKAMHGRYGSSFGSHAMYEDIVTKGEDDESVADE
jgi:hypothetical protein